jgi:hypothetical protein
MALTAISGKERRSLYVNPRFDVAYYFHLQGRKPAEQETSYAFAPR